MREFIDSLLSKMTVSEKMGQLVQCGNSIYNDDYKVGWDLLREGKIGSFLGICDPEIINELQRTAVEETRLGIPLLFGFDVIHGFETTFPVPWAEACSWDTELAKKTAAIASAEAGAQGINWIYAPMVDVARDARWGRIVEGAGEDPYLGGEFAKARTEGVQSDIPDIPHVAACAKHFAAYGAAEGGRDYNSVDMSPQTLYNMYLPPFQKAIDAGADSIMTAFHDLNGEPCTGSYELLTEILRDKMNFKGVTISDAGSTNQIKTHGYAEDDKDVARIALNAGLDVEMCFGIYTYQDHIEQLVEEGKISMEVLDRAVRRVLELKYKCGLFENPYRDVKKAKDILLTKTALDTAYESAVKSVVLLKNDNSVLPFKKDIKLAVIGPFADNSEEMLGAWSAVGKAENVINPLCAISDVTETVYEKGCNFDSCVDMEKAVETVKQCDAVVVFIGEPRDMNGEGKSRTRNVIPKAQLDLLKAVKAAGKPTAAVVIAGRPVVLTEVCETADAVIFSGALGSMAGKAYADILFGVQNPSGKLVNTFPTTVGQAPLYYNHNNTGKPPVEEFFWTSKYCDCPIEPLFPFGFGLSYTSYSYDNMRINSECLNINDTLSVSVDVTNTGGRDGEETVQFYIRDVVGSIVRPVKELKAYKKVFIKAGETKTVTADIPVSDMGFYNKKLEYVVENGKFIAYVGGNSRDTLEREFEVTGSEET